MAVRRPWQPWTLFLVAALVAGCAAPAAAPAKPPSGSAPAASSAASAPAGGTAAAPAREPRALQVGLIGLAGYWYTIWAGQRSGAFRELGLNPERVSLQTNEAISALSSGGLDILQSPTDSAITALSKGANLTLVADYALEAPYDLVARPEITSVEGLRGLKVGASSLKAGTGTIARVMLRGRGLTDDDYELTQTGGNPQRYAALQSGGTQAAVIADPVNFIAKLDGYRILLSFSDIVPQYSFVSWWVRRDWLDTPQNREDLVNFIAGLIRGKAWAHDPANREALLNIWMEETQSPRAVAEQMYDYYIVQHPKLVDSSGLLAEPIGAVIKLQQELEDLPALPPESQWVDRSITERARQVAGAAR
ncbi:MAG TPA: ABC transporter substrate-binding protein [Chloroflexota bacterium]|nr:ABC transporter substrate-binding protein [Chloroflexota bacterium]